MVLRMKNFQDVEKLIILLKTRYKQNISHNSTVVKAIYLFGSYPRNDFVIGRSDLDFAVILEVPENTHHWNHPDFQLIVDLTKECTELPPQYLRQSGLDFCSFSCIEIEQTKRNELKVIIGPIKLLTFFAFDFLVYNELLWGTDLLQGFPTIPNPNHFATTRLNWIRSFYFKKAHWTGSNSDRLLMTLGSIVRHFAVVKGGLRTLKRNILKEWALTYEKWSENTQDVLIPYFEFIEGQAYKNKETFLDSLPETVTVLLDEMEKARTHE